MFYLEPRQLSSAYQTAVSTARRNWTKFDEFERLAANELRGDIPKNMPRVNDGSLAALLRETPMRILAKPMEGEITSIDRDEDWVNELVQIIWSRIIIPNANTDAPFLNKWQTALTRALTYGSQPIYTFFTQHGSYSGADFALPYIKNCYLEPGKVSDLASDYIFMDSYYTKLQLKNLIERAVTMEGEGAETMWDAEALKRVYDAGPSGKDAQSFNANERDGKNSEQQLYKLVTCFNRGQDSPFYTFAPNTSNTVVGTAQNTNPSGDIPIIYLYADNDQTNPYGMGQVQISGGTQNVLDYLTQADVLATQIGLQPPIQVKGDRTSVDLKSMVYAPSQYWFTGQTEVEVQRTSSDIYGQFPTRFGLYKSQLQNLQGTTDATVSSESGNPGFSKTDAGVKQQQARTSAHDNFLTQRVGDAFRRTAKSMINIHMNNMEGSEVVRLLGDEIDRLAKTDLINLDPVTGEPDTNEVEVVWDNMRGDYEFEVDPESSLLEANKKDTDQLTQLIQLAVQNPNIVPLLQQSGWKLDLGEGYAETFRQLGVKDIDKILTKISPEEMSEMEAQANAQAVDPTTGEPILDNNVDPSSTDPSNTLPTGEATPEQPSSTSVDNGLNIDAGQGQEQVRRIMEEYNVDEDKAVTILAALAHVDDPAIARQLADYMHEEVA